ncbi:hypothetical protein IHQ71_30930 (plasmid) [Rhizobium sp. TH2]|uniref:hypothetical protein n=1 Tax=Rhizobium sp. TH2 TaxID=2775403 RepID=UPI00215808C4|nr:hypothetical protein [Rhizobium sp. TH2]UVC12418.1 hypothetical protein IHQ71_30930 [Rhizobium sp. TH2]
MSDLTVGLFIRDERGALDLISEHEYQYFGVCPGLGDVICVSRLGRPGNDFYRVAERVFMDVPSYPGWAIVLEPIENSKHLTKLSREWALSEQTERKLNEDERAERIDGSWDRLDRLLSEREWEKYPRLYPNLSELPLVRKPLPNGVKSPINPPLEWMEKRVLNALLEKPLTKVPTTAIHGTGPATVKALVDRGYLEVNEEGPKRTLISLTEKATKDIEADKSLRRKYTFPGSD